MEIVMISNYLNHHQTTFCDEINALTDNHFRFVATEPVSTFRKNLGYRDMDHEKGYVIASYVNSDKFEKAQVVCQEADVLIIGGVAKGFPIKKRKNQIVFYYSERLFKEEKIISKNIGRFIKYLLMHREFKQSYLLCASAYAKKDYQITGNFKGRAYKWGYFPPTKEYEIKDIERKKDHRVTKILWTGRLINWKHPEMAIETAEYLQNKNLQFEMEMIGSGEMESELQNLLNMKGLSDKVHLLGSLPQEKVREHMEEANIFLFTSDRNEGWGAVVNEAMNSGCAVIGCKEAGSTPYLIDNQTGYIFGGDDKMELFTACERMVLDKSNTLKMGISAYEKIRNEWNGKIAAKRLIQLIEGINKGKLIVFDDGPCSLA